MQGEGPGARYAHVLALVGQRFLLVLGGNDGYKVRRRSRLPLLQRAATLVCTNFGVGGVRSRWLMLGRSILP